MKTWVAIRIIVFALIAVGVTVHYHVTERSCKRARVFFMLVFPLTGFVLIARVRDTSSFHEAEIIAPLFLARCPRARAKERERHLEGNQIESTTWDDAKRKASNETRRFVDTSSRVVSV